MARHYREGTVAVTNGSATVTGSATGWDSQVKPGDEFEGPDGALYEVAAVNSNTSITIAETYAGSTASGQSYAIKRYSGAWSSVADLSLRISNFLQNLVGVFGGTGVPSDTLGSDGSYYFRVDTGIADLYRKAAGAWSLVTSLRGPAGAIGPGFSATSTSTVNIGTGLKGFTLAGGAVGTAYLGARLRAAATAAPVNFLEGVVTAATSTTVTINAEITGGSGSHSSWNLVASGNPGAAGPAGPASTGTSTTSLALGTGTKIFTTQAGLDFIAGLVVRAADQAGPVNKWMQGTVTAYSGTTLTLSVPADGSSVSGSGTISAWNIGLVGARGPTGPAGAAGAASTVPGPGYAGTSTSSVAIGAGSKVFATQTGLAYVSGSRVRVSSVASPTDTWMEGIVTSYASGNLTISVGSDGFAGTGTVNDWTISIAGEPGRDGVDGADGTTIQSVGVYSGATTYSLYDTAVNEGSTWIYINATPSAGNAPPTLPTQSNAYWHLFARAGNNGTSGIYPTKASIGLVDLTGIDAITVARWDTSSVIEPATWRRVASEPSHVGKQQDVTGAWFELAEAEVSPSHLGAPVDPLADASAAVQAAFDLMKTSWNATAQMFARTVNGRGRTYTVATSINLTNIRQAGMFAWNMHLRGTCAGKAVIDLSGTQGGRFAISFWGDKTSSPRCAFLVSRASYLGAFGGAGLHDFRECEFTGSFNGMAIINYGGEVIKYPRQRVWNQYKSATRAAIMITGNSQYLAKWLGAGSGVDGSSLVSDYAVLPTGVVSCINHLFDTVDFRRPSPWGALAISSISKSTPGVVTLAAPTTEIVDGNGTYFTDITGMTELNRTTAYLKRVTDDTYELYSNATLTTPLNTSTYGTFTHGFLWGATGPAVVLAAAKGFTSAEGYILTYGGDAIVLDTQFGDVVDDLHWNIQHEAVPQRSVRVVTPTSGNVTLAKVSFSFLNAAQDWRDSIIGAQPLGGTVTINGLKLDVRAWASPPGIGVVAPGSITLKSCDIRVPDGAYFDPNDFATRATGTVTDYTTSITQEYYPGFAWTPALTFGGASAGMVYTQREGWYEVHGEMVVAHFAITLSNKGTSTGTVRVSLPVDVHASQSGHGALHRPTGMASLTSPVTIEVPAGVNNGNFYHHGATGATLLSEGNVSSTATIRGWMTYRRAA